MTGPMVAHSTSKGVRVEWLVKFCLTDQGAPFWPEMNCFFGVKMVRIEQLQAISCFMLVREKAVDHDQQHLVPQYCAGVVLHQRDEIRVPFLFPLLRDRFGIVAKRLLISLRDDEDMTVVPSGTLERMWMWIKDVQRDCTAWLSAFVSRKEVEDAALPSILSVASSPNCVTFLSHCLGQRCVIVRGSCSDQVKQFIAFIMLFLPDDKLCLCSLEVHNSLEEVVPNLAVQGTTLPLCDKLVCRSLMSQFPTAIIDLDSADGQHFIPPSSSEFPIEWIDHRLIRESFLLDEIPPKYSLRPCSGVSSVTEDIVSLLRRCSDHSGSLSRWRQRMKFLSLRCVSCELPADSSFVPIVEPLDNDIFLNFANFSCGRATIRRKLKEARAKFDDF